MTKTQIKNVMLNPTIEGLEMIKEHTLTLKGNVATSRAIEKSIEDILNAQKCLADIIAQYDQT